MRISTINHVSKPISRSVRFGDEPIQNDPELEKCQQGTEKAASLLMQRITSASNYGAISPLLSKPNVLKSIKVVTFLVPNKKMPDVYQFLRGIEGIKKEKEPQDPTKGVFVFQFLSDPKNEESAIQVWVDDGTPKFRAASDGNAVLIIGKAVLDSPPVRFIMGAGHSLLNRLKATVKKLFLKS